MWTWLMVRVWSFFHESEYRNKVLVYSILIVGMIVLAGVIAKAVMM